MVTHIYDVIIGFHIAFQTNIFIVNMAIADTISVFRLLMKVDYELNGKLWRNCSIFSSKFEIF